MDSNLFDPRKTFGNEVARVAATDDRVVAISTDSGNSSGFGEFSEAFPDRYFEVGIAEQAATGIASGLATFGYTPVFAAIAPFVTCRNYEQFRNDIGYMKQNVKIVGRNGGFTYSDLGSTHHSLEDYAIIRMIPGVRILTPQDETEIREATAAMLREEGPFYMRLGVLPGPRLFEPGRFEIGKAKRLCSGSDVTVVSCGYATENAMEAVRILRERGFSVDHLGLGTVVPLDEEAILESAKRTGVVVSVEEHYSIGGLGGEIAELLSSVSGVVSYRIGVAPQYVHSGPYDELVADLGLSPQGIADQVQSHLRTDPIV